MYLEINQIISGRRHVWWRNTDNTICDHISRIW